MRLWTFGGEEVRVPADFALTICDSAASDVTVVTDVVHGGQRAIDCATNSQSFFARALSSSKTSGKLYTRQYVYFRSFGAAPNTFGTIQRWTDTAGNTRVGVQFNPSTKKFRLNNVGTGSSVTTDGTVAVAAQTWYRIETEVVISSSAVGSITIKIFDGDKTVPLDTISATGVITMPSSSQFTGLEIGNRTGIDWGRVVIDDCGVNDEAGTFQNSWLGPGKVEMLTPNGIGMTQWLLSGINALISDSGAEANLLEANMAGPNDAGTSEAPATATTNYEAVNDTYDGSVNDADYTFSTSGSGDSDKLYMSDLQSADVVSGSLVLMDVYARIGGNGVGSMRLRVWDGGGSTAGSAFTIPTNETFRKLTTSEHVVYTLTGRTLTDTNLIYVGYEAVSGVGVAKRVSALWANVEYTPSGLTTVSSARTVPYSFTANTVSNTAKINLSSSAFMAVTAISNIETKGSASSVSNSKSIAYEVLRSLRQQF